MATLARSCRATCLVLVASGCGWGMAARAELPVAAISSASQPLAGLPLRRERAAANAGSSWLAASGALALVAFGGTVMVGRRRGWPWLRARDRARRQEGPLRTASQALTAQASIHAVRWHGEELLLGCTAQQVSVLARRTLAPAEKDAP